MLETALCIALNSYSSHRDHYLLMSRFAALPRCMRDREKSRAPRQDKKGQRLSADERKNLPRWTLEIHLV